MDKRIKDLKIFIHRMPKEMNPENKSRALIKTVAAYLSTATKRKPLFYAVPMK